MICLSLLMSTTLLLTLLNTSESLNCIQCRKDVRALSQQKQNSKQTKNLAELCQLGQLEATPCLNKTHTRCLTHLYRQLSAFGEVLQVSVLWRECGISRDSCQTFQVGSAKDDKTMSSYANSKSSRYSSNSVHTTDLTHIDRFEVCVRGCDHSNCHISVSSSTIIKVDNVFILLSTVLFALLVYQCHVSCAVLL